MRLSCPPRHSHRIHILEWLNVQFEHADREKEKEQEQEYDMVYYVQDFDGILWLMVHGYI